MELRDRLAESAAVGSESLVYSDSTKLMDWVDRPRNATELHRRVELLCDRLAPSFSEIPSGSAAASVSGWEPSADGHEAWCVVSGVSSQDAAYALGRMLKGFDYLYDQGCTNAVICPASRFEVEYLHSCASQLARKKLAEAQGSDARPALGYVPSG